MYSCHERLLFTVLSLNCGYFILVDLTIMKVAEHLYDSLNGY